MWRRHTLKQHHHCQVLFPNWTIRVKQHTSPSTAHLLPCSSVTPLAHVIFWPQLFRSYISRVPERADAQWQIKSHNATSSLQLVGVTTFKLATFIMWCIWTDFTSTACSRVFSLSSKNGKGPEPLLIQMFGSNVVCAKWTLTACLSHYSTQRSTPTLSSKSTNSLPFTSHSPEPK